MRSNPHPRRSDGAPPSAWSRSDRGDRCQHKQGGGRGGGEGASYKTGRRQQARRGSSGSVIRRKGWGRGSASCKRGQENGRGPVNRWLHDSPCRAGSQTLSSHLYSKSRVFHQPCGLVRLLASPGNVTVCSIWVSRRQLVDHNPYAFVVREELTYPYSPCCQTRACIYLASIHSATDSNMSLISW